MWLGCYLIFYMPCFLGGWHLPNFTLLPVSLLAFPIWLYSVQLLAKSVSLLTNDNKSYSRPGGGGARL